MTEPFKDISHEIINRCKNGDRNAYEELYRLYSKAAFSAAMRILNNYEDAQEVIQDSFLKAYQNLETFDKKYSFGVWIKRIVINRSLDVHKSRKIDFVEFNNEILSEEDDYVEEVIYDVEQIKRCIQNLPDGYRTILSLILFEDYKHKEIAELLNISEGTSKSQYKRAKKRLVYELINNKISDGR